jgi:hypothetical protein
MPMAAAPAMASSRSCSADDDGHHAPWLVVVVVVLLKKRGALSTPTRKGDEVEDGKPWSGGDGVAPPPLALAAPPSRAADAPSAAAAAGAREDCCPAAATRWSRSARRALPPRAGIKRERARACKGLRFWGCLWRFRAPWLMCDVIPCVCVCVREFAQSRGRMKRRACLWCLAWRRPEAPPFEARRRDGSARASSSPPSLALYRVAGFASDGGA